MPWPVQIPCTENLFVVANFNADKYRDRPTAEIAEDQRQLEALKLKANLGNKATWEWDGHSRVFIVSKGWEELTGYNPAEVFPIPLAQGVEIEDLFDNLIEDWMNLVALGDRAAVKKGLNNLLIYRRTNTLKLDFKLIRKDGTQVITQTTIQVVWEGRRLMQMFVQNENLNDVVKRYLNPGEAAAAIVHSQSEIKENSEQIREVEARAESLDSKVDRVAALGKLAPLALAALVAFNDFSLSLLGELRRSATIWLNPPEIEQSPSMPSDDFLLNTLSQPQIDALKDILTRYSTYGDTVRLAAYEPGPVPSRYRYLLQEKQSQLEIPFYTTQPVLIGDSPTDLARAERHLSNQPSLYINGKDSYYSVPLTIRRKDGRSQTVFVSIEGDDAGTQRATEAQDAAKRMAAEVKGILDAQG